jgi:hypothetical protein
VVVRERLIGIIIGNVMGLRDMFIEETRFTSVNVQEGGNAVTYFEAESMRQEFNTAVLYRDIFPDKYKEVAKRYIPGQWSDCGKVILKKIEDDKRQFIELLAFVEKVRKGK